MPITPRRGPKRPTRKPSTRRPADGRPATRRAASGRATERRPATRTTGDRPARPSLKRSSKPTERGERGPRAVGKRVATAFHKFESKPLTLVKRGEKSEKLDIASTGSKTFSGEKKPFRGGTRSGTPLRNGKGTRTAGKPARRYDKPGTASGIKRRTTGKSPAKAANGLVKKRIATPTTAAPTTSEASSSASGTIRLNKFISNAGITSRRKADELITQGAVRVNGKVITELGVQVKPHEDLVTVNGEPISLKPRLLYLLLNKPKDTITTTSDEKDRTTVLDYVKTAERVYPVGRLDRNTTGVLLLTNDGELTNRLTHPSFEIEREYHVTLDKALESNDARKIAEGGLNIGDGDVTASAEVSVDQKEHRDVLIKLHEGKNREVRRIFESLGYEVEKLDRIAFAGLTHRGMGRGESRPLTNAEVHLVKRLAGLETD